MLDCFVAGVEENTLLSAGSVWETCLDTSMFQRQVYRDMALNAVQVAAWGAADKMAGNESDRLGNAAAPAVISNVTHQKKLWVYALHVDAITVSGMMWFMMVAMSIAIISYICCSLRTTNPLPLASPSGSVPHTPRSARGAQVGRPAIPLCEKGGDSCHVLGFGSGLLSPATATTAASSVESVTPRGFQLVTPRGFLFTVLMEALSDMAGKSSFSIKDTFSSAVLRGSVSQNSHGLRKVQLFLGEDATIPCASVEQPPPGPQGIPGILELRGANNVHLGSLILQSTGSFVVRAPGQPDLIVEGKEAGSDIVFSRDGGLKATVMCKETYPGGPEQVEIHVLPGIDSVLIVACTLAILFLCGER